LSADSGGGGGDVVHPQWEFMVGFIADLSYVNFVPLGNFLDINGAKIYLGSTFGRSQIDLFSPQK